MTSRSFGGEAQRATPTSTASGPVPAARGHSESSGTRALCVSDAATGSAEGAAWVWEERTGGAQSAMPTGEQHSSVTAAGIAVQKLELLKDIAVGGVIRS